MSGYEELTGTAVVEESAPVTVAPEAVTQEPEVQAPAPAEPAQPQPAAQPQQPHSVPLDVLLRTREEFGGKLTQAEQRALIAERRLAEIDRQAKEQSDQIPHPLDEPEKFVQWQRNYLAKTSRDLEQKFERARIDDRLQTSRELIEDSLPPEEFKSLCSFIDTWTPQMHAQAQKQPHPYRWALKQKREAEKAQRSEKVLSELGDRNLEDLIEERAAARLAELQASQTPPAEEQPAQPRAPDGKFASPTQPQQRRSAPSLNVVPASSVGRGEPASGYDALFKQRG